MTREEATQELTEWIKQMEDHGVPPYSAKYKALKLAIEALQFVEHFDLLKEYQSLQEVVQCNDCRHASECHKSVQYTRNELNTVTIGYSPIEWCSRGERKAP